MQSDTVSEKLIYEHDSLVYTFTPDSDSKMIERLKQIEFATSDKLVNNYTTINWYDFQAITVLLQDEKIISFSSVWNRPFYGSNQVRILNRYWKCPESRRVTKVISGPHIIESVKQQLAIAKQLGFDTCFISRENNINYFTLLINTIAQGTATEWTIGDDRMPVCDPNQKSCWQYKAWTKI